MSTGVIVLLVIAFLAAPIFLLAGVGIGACLVWRIMKGQPPLPAIFSRKTSKVVSAKPPENDKPKPPRVAA